jgi:tryptophanyl-tRNA synthetase
MITAVYPLAMFAPDIMPVRLDLIDAGYGQSEFLQMCRELAARYRMVVYDYEAYHAASFGAIPMRV